jgi:acylglycerol lipase
MVHAQAKAMGIVRGAMMGLAMLVVSACVPTVQRALVPTLPEPPRFEGNTFVSFDGARLGLTVYAPPEGQAPWAAIVALHGMGDYANAFHLAGPAWAEQGVITYAYDARGHGRSPRRGIWGGEALLREDLRTAVQVARAANPGAIVAVVGESMGAATALAAFGDDSPPQADRLVLIAPAVWGWSSLPRSYAASLWLGAHTLPGRPVTAPRFVQRRIQPSDNLEMMRAMGRDPLMVFETRIDAIYGLVSLMEQASDRAGRVSVPTAFLYGARDDIIPFAAARGVALRLPAGSRTALYADGYHLLLRDLGRAAPLGDVLAFLRDPTAPFPSGAMALTDPRAEDLVNARRLSN